MFDYYIIKISFLKKDYISAIKFNNKNIIDKANILLKNKMDIELYYFIEDKSIKKLINNIILNKKIKEIKKGKNDSEFKDFLIKNSKINIIENFSKDAIKEKINYYVSYYGSISYGWNVKEENYGKLDVEKTSGKYCVYMHISPSNKKYIGISSNPIKRWDNGNGYKTQLKFFTAIKKYGWENF